MSDTDPCLSLLTLYLVYPESKLVITWGAVHSRAFPPNRTEQSRFMLQASQVLSIEHWLADWKTNTFACFQPWEFLSGSPLPHIMSMDSSLPRFPPPLLVCHCPFKNGFLSSGLCQSSRVTTCAESGFVGNRLSEGSGVRLKECSRGWE